MQLPEDLDRTIITSNYNPPGYEYFREDDLALYDLPQPPEGIPILFYRQCVWNIKNRGQVIQRYCKEADIERDHELPLDISWNYYQHLVQQQKAVKSSGADAEALRYGLERFPALRKITITPATHGRLDFPLYETPMIRASPAGFNYPIIWTWPQPAVSSGAPYNLRPWNRSKHIWRGFGVITSVLAEKQSHNISELVVDVYSLETGLNCRISDQPWIEYNDFVTLIQKPGFSR